MVIETAAFFVQIRSPGTVTAASMALSTLAVVPDVVFPNVTSFRKPGGSPFSDYVGSSPASAFR